MPKISKHDAALVASVKAALDAAIVNSEHPIAIAKRVHSPATRHRMKGRASAIKRHPFARMCEASGRPLDWSHAQLDGLDPEIGFTWRVRWVCPKATNNGHNSWGGCK